MSSVFGEGVEAESLIHFSLQAEQQWKESVAWSVWRVLQQSL